jgi:hypothetical protein
VLTVGNDAAGVERMLEEGSLCCPGCGGRLARWGHALERTVFGPGRVGSTVRPRRSRCVACRVTHVLLPVRLLLRRMDEAPVTGAALAAAARGLGHRRVARDLQVPEDTVRGWLRRAAVRAGQVREVFTRVAAAVNADPVPLEPAGSPLADALVAVAAAAAAAAERWPRPLAVSPWEFASAVTNATLMAPVMAVWAFNGAEENTLETRRRSLDALVSRPWGGC